MTRMKWMLMAGLWAVISPLAQAVDPLTLTLGEGTTNIGGTAEISLTVNSGGTAPAALVLFIKYDSAKVQPYTDFYEFIKHDLDGAVVDNQGNVVKSRSAVRPEASLDAAGKLVETEIHSEGVMAIAIVGKNSNEILDGPIATIAFRVLSGAQENEYIALDGIGSTETAVVLTHGTAKSSAAGAALESIPVLFVDGRVHVGCTPAETPGGVMASQGQTDAVVVSWSAVTEANARYRVYRNTEENPETASPLGTGWQTGLVFQDLSAQAPVVTGGCSCSPVYSVVRYYYWVKSQNAFGCESDFSTPAAEGYRGTAKASLTKAGVASNSLGDWVMMAVLLCGVVLWQGMERTKARR